MDDAVLQRSCDRLLPGTVGAVMSGVSAARTKAKILCVLTWRLGGDSGSWRALQVAGALQDLGYEVMVHQYVTSSVPQPTSPVPARFDSIPREVFELSRASTPWHHHRIVAQDGFDVVIGNNMNGAAYSLLGRVKAPLILDCHGDMVAEQAMDPSFSERHLPARVLRGAVYRLADGVTRKMCDRITCVSREMIRRLAARGVPQAKLVYAPNCVDLEFFRPPDPSEVESLRIRLGVGPEQLLFGYLGMAHPWQGIEQFVEAAECSENADLAFLLVGMESAADRRNLHIVGEVPVREMPLFYSICDVCVLPRPSHPATDVAAPTKFVEYAAMEKPIIATDVGDAAELIREYGCGIVVADNSLAELNRGFAEMLALGPDERQKMGQAARRMAETEFDFRITKANLARCIEELTAAT